MIDCEIEGVVEVVQQVASIRAASVQLKKESLDPADEKAPSGRKRSKDVVAAAFSGSMKRNAVTKESAKSRAEGNTSRSAKARADLVSVAKPSAREEISVRSARANATQTREPDKRATKFGAQKAAVEECVHDVDTVGWTCQQETAASAGRFRSASEAKACAQSVNAYQEEGPWTSSGQHETKGEEGQRARARKSSSGSKKHNLGQDQCVCSGSTARGPHRRSDELDGRAGSIFSICSVASRVGPEPSIGIAGRAPSVATSVRRASACRNGRGESVCDCEE